MTQAAKLADVPNQPKRKSPRNVRVPDELWEGAKTTAEDRGENLSEHVIRPALRDYTADPDKWVDEHPKEDA